MVRMIYTIVWLVGCLLLGLSFAWSASVSGVGGGAAQGLGGNFNISGGNIITGASESKQLRFLDSGGTNGGTMYWHSSGKLVITCVVANVEGACDVYPQLNAGKKWGVKNSSGAVIFEVEESTGEISSAVVDCSLGGVDCYVYQQREFEFVGCQAGTAGHIWNTPASNAPAAACDANNTNTIKGYASFDDTTDETIYASMRLPPSYLSGTLQVTFIWKASSTTGAVGLCMQAVRVPDGTTSDQALPAQSSSNCVSDAAKGTALQENTATLGGVTCSSCVGGDEIKIAFSRDANGSAVTDSMTGDAHVIKAIVRWLELQ